MLKLFFALFILLAALDLLWMTFLGGTFYRSVLGNILQTGPASPTVVFAIFTLWGLLVTGVLVFVLPQKNPLLAGALFGLIVYGVYELTNFALLKKWSLAVVFVDTVWGVALFAFLGYAGKKLSMWLG